MKTLKESLLGNANLGRVGQIKQWLDEMEIKNYTINDDFTIDVNGNVDLQFKNLNKFPPYIKFNKINGEFLCNFTNINSLEGFPKRVEGNFFCANTKIKTLKGCPEYVGGDFSCFMNNLTTLKYGPKFVGGSYHCSYNKLTSLKGIPEDVKELDFTRNPITNIDYLPKDLEIVYCQEINIPNIRQQILNKVKNKNIKIIASVEDLEFL